VAALVDEAHDAGAFTLVDAVQAPGQTPLDVREWGADAVAAAGHKWLLGLWGAGFLYVDADVASRLTPRTVGYRSVTTPTADRPTFASGARRFEVGSASPAPHVALREAIEAIEDVGIETIESRIQTLVDRLTAGVPDDRLYSPTIPESGLVTIDVDDPPGTVARLRDAGIIIRGLPHPEAIRVSVHAVNTAEEVDRLVTALEPEW
jgi:selenocysteine lyase/cysteine desulfurase